MMADESKQAVISTSFFGAGSSAASSGNSTGSVEDDLLMHDATSTIGSGSSSVGGGIAAAAVAAASETLSIGDGEILFLMESVQFEEEEPLPLSEQLEAAINSEIEEIIVKTTSDSATSPATADISTTTTHHELSPYGHPLSVQDAIEMMPPGTEGRIWYSTLLPDQYISGKGKVVNGMNPRDVDLTTGTIKPRRPSLTITQSDFFSSVTKICEAGIIRPRFVFYGILNGWPSLRCFELLAIERKGKLHWHKVWHIDDHGVRGINPQHCIDKEKQVYRMTLRGPPWTEYGWSKDSLGFVFWYEAQQPNEADQKVIYGTRLVTELKDKDAICTKIHMISHRYAKERESPRDLLTYHSLCLLEWDHGKYCTVTEAAYLNGMGGYRGRTNWYDDKDEPVTKLFSLLPPEMICPWDNYSAEVRCYDVPATNLQQFQSYMNKYVGNKKRFIDPQYSFSHAARITFRSKQHIAQYLLNYILRDSQYAELKRNCQTFCADLCVLIAGKKNVQPFHPVIRFEYQNRSHFFLYDHHMYDTKSKNKKIPSKKK